MNKEQLLKQGKIPLNFIFRLLHKTKIIYLVLIFLISIGISGWTVESYFVRIPILGFHDIVNIQNSAELPPHRNAFSTDYTKQDLAVFLEYLFQQNYWFLSSQDLYLYFIEKSKPIPPQHEGQKPIMITFDDGYKGVHTNALPLIEKLSFIYKEKGKFVLFVNPHFLGVDMGGEFLPHTSCNDLREGYKKGFYDIQSHGFSHKNLTTLNGKNLELEISKSKLILRKCMSNLDKNKLVGAHIAYPYGASDREVESILPKYHLTGFLYDDNLLRVSRLRNNYRISRMTVSKDMSPTDLIRIAEKASTLRKKRWF
ncbi:MAG: polysaccharide deacetylase family protein [Oscillatoriales cyanobacterium]|uniref:Polysaccharide deacetylase family protein n=1 Tax=Microcoleus anatoxicus PTRS2 TaxID=2705321 RepID=A0ABU8YT54_9CYAN|nr:MAG: polysaccharide deacetylase family protein [Oscillatoriales cyanobacterium]TAD94272.1 MAG: polysaccharide deacetylase family protein [Oscillatoriales cyanobacterium]TAE01616.1 MAG: polysaccharide deacetylase family protein [Oscillatoriales cyanobacterium]TAE98214.1 MAG: polysaccharide deacetylase family protein [Oscillatoriales cyanobacterium]TAF33886.1 MAG: polysaccharide deacetylase family protein [Oscillatoriales cyanobacterium]